PAAETRAFLESVLLARLRLPPASLDPASTVATFTGSLEEARAKVSARRNLVHDAVHASGGLPRMFLQLMADAATYARIRRQGDWPILEDLNDACSDQIDSFRRVLLPGDTAACLAAINTDGRELEIARKVRLMAHGVLLERLR